MTRETIEIESKDADRVHILAGTIVSTSDGMAEVDIDGYEIFADVPVFYHCPDSETADGIPFVEDDRVIVVNYGDTEILSALDMKIIGFEDGLPRMCCLKEKWYRSLTEYYDWVETYTWFEDLPVIPFSVINGEDYKNSYLEMRHTGSRGGNNYESTSKMYLKWITVDVPESDTCNNLRLKFNFSGTYPIDQYDWPTITKLTIGGPVGGPAIIIFGANPQYFIRYPATVDLLLDDAGGAEQVINLKDYGATFEGPIRYINLTSECRSGEVIPYVRNYQSLDLYYLEFF